MTLATVDHIALATADPAALLQQDVFCSHETTINKDNVQSPLNRNSGNRPLVYQSCQDKGSCRNNSKGLRLKDQKTWTAQKGNGWTHII